VQKDTHGDIGRRVAVVRWSGPAGTDAKRMENAKELRLPVSGRLCRARVQKLILTPVAAARSG
jgi:hypothetical protein